MTKYFLVFIASFLAGFLCAFIVLLINVIPRISHEQFALGVAGGKVQGNLEVLAALQDEFGYENYEGKNPNKIIFSNGGMDLVAVQTNGVETVRLLMKKSSN